MKSIKILAVSAAVLMAVACGSNAGSPNASADSLKAAKQYKPSKSLADSVSYFLGINYGQMLKSYNFGELDYNLMVKGMKDFVNAKGNMNDEDFTDQFMYNPEVMNEAINKFLRQHSEYLSVISAEEEKKFFASNAKKEGVVETESGLQYLINEAGSEKRPGPKDTVVVRYRGTLLDGTVFDEAENGVKFELNHVIAGWTEGLQFLGEGGSMTLYVPAELGYGKRATGSIPSNSTLVFDINLDEVKHFVEKAEKAE